LEQLLTLFYPYQLKELAWKLGKGGEEGWRGTKTFPAADRYLPSFAEIVTNF